MKYLRQIITSREPGQTELQHRVKCAWATFTHHRQEFTRKNCLLKERLGLYEATVSPTILHAVGTWAMTEATQTQFNSMQRRMVRMILNGTMQQKSEREEEEHHEEVSSRDQEEE